MNSTPKTRSHNAFPKGADISLAAKLHGSTLKEQTICGSLARVGNNDIRALKLHKYLSSLLRKRTEDKNILLHGSPWKQQDLIFPKYSPVKRDRLTQSQAEREIGIY